MTAAFVLVAGLLLCAALLVLLDRLPLFGGVQEDPQ